MAGAGSGAPGSPVTPGWWRWRESNSSEPSGPVGTRWLRAQPSGSVRTRRVPTGPAVDAVNGGGGGVGASAIQAAKPLGASVTGVDATRKLETMRTAGADRVVDCRLEDVMSGDRKYDVIIDAHHPIWTYRRCLTAGGHAGLLGGSVPRVNFAMAHGPVDHRSSPTEWTPLLAAQ
ncbi:MAG: zinc-binding dehydrogenase [Desulfomicrobium escambiense]|nr:zinc-binding dehydrogenase [Desulfomicrobium escambiense]